MWPWNSLKWGAVRASETIQIFSKPNSPAKPGDCLVGKPILIQKFESLLNVEEIITYFLKY
jgi:hypothetical protein